MAARVPGHVGLVASDEMMTLIHLSALLREEGYLVLSAADGLEALELSRMYHGGIDLILVDRRMTRLDDLCACLLEARPDARMLVLLEGDFRGMRGTNLAAGGVPAESGREKLKKQVRAVLAAPRPTEPIVYVAFAEGLPA